MADIIVTTPKSQVERAAREVEQIKAQGGGFYFRNLGMRKPKRLATGDRCFYVENGAVRGYCLVEEVTAEPSMVCEASGAEFGPGVYVFMDATTWTWCEPIPMPGFQGWRYSTLRTEDVVPLGGWLEPRPE